MNALNPCCWLGLALLTLASARGQTAGAASLPAGPYPPRPAPQSAWEIDYEYPPPPKPEGSAAAPAPVVVGALSPAPCHRITLYFDLPRWHAVIETTDGHRADEWSDGVAQYFTSDTNPKAGLVPKALDGPILPNFDRTPFADMGGLSPQSYTKDEAVDGYACHVFQVAETTVWLDAQTLLPVKWVRGTETRHYHPTTPKTVILPMEVEKAARDYHRYQQSTTPARTGG